MNSWTKPVYIKFRLWFLLIILIVLGIIVSGVVLHKNYAFHNLFFRSLSLSKIESIYVYNCYEQGIKALSAEESEAVVSLLRNIRLKGEPYKKYSLLGDNGNNYHVKLKNGISFDLNLSGGNPGAYIINDEAYIIGCREDLSTSDEFENIWCLEELYSEYIKKYYPNNK